MIQKHDKQFMDIARVIAAGSRCKRARFGSVIVAADRRRIVSTGYNGKPAGSKCDNLCFREGLEPNSGAKPYCCIHSEQNAIMFCSPEERRGATLYVTGRPCGDCSVVILQSGIVRLVYLVVTGTSHPGWTGDDVFTKYGVPLQLVPYTDEWWEEQHGERKRPNVRASHPFDGGPQQTTEIDEWAGWKGVSEPE